MNGRKVFTFIVGSALCAIGFQNCSAPQHSRLSSAIGEEADNGFFAYPYKTAPEFFVHLAVYKSQDSTENSLDIKFLSSVANPNGPGKINYQVKILDEKGDLLCPIEKGALANQESWIDFDCTLTNPAITIISELTLESGEKQTVFTKKY